MAKARRRRRSRAPSSSTGGVGREHWRADGQPKARFPTEDEANRSALRLRLEAGADLGSYLCHFCGGWHLANRGTPPDDRPEKGSSSR